MTLLSVNIVPYLGDLHVASLVSPSEEIWEQQCNVLASAIHLPQSAHPECPSMLLLMDQHHERLAIHCGNTGGHDGIVDLPAVLSCTPAIVCCLLAGERLLQS